MSTVTGRRPHYLRSSLELFNQIVSLAMLTAVTGSTHVGAQATTAVARGEIHGVVVNVASKAPFGSAEVDVMT